MDPKNIRPKKYLSLNRLSAVLQTWRLKEDRLVFTNGCFDLFHAGHVHVLEEAARLGDRLIVGLNSDASVRRLKGKFRPVNTEDHRAYLLAALACVDLVVLFEEDTPARLIETVEPQVLVKGGDYDLDQIVGADFVSGRGGEVVTIPLLEGFSSTDLMAKFSQ